MTPTKIRVLQPIWVTAENRTIMPSEDPIEVDWTPEVLEAVALAGALEILPSESPRRKTQPPATEVAEE